MADQITIKQHYIPQFYLKNFSMENSNKVWTYDQSRMTYRKRRISEICCENYLYESGWKHKVKKDQLILPNKLENEFSGLERRYSDLIRNVINICNDPANANVLILNCEQKQLAASFVSNILLRNPWTMDRFIGEFDDNKLSSDWDPYREILDAIPVTDMESFYYEANKVALLSKENGGSEAHQIQKLIRYMYVSIWKAPANSEYITSSFPILYDTVDISGVEKTVLEYIFIPLSPKYGLSYYMNRHQGFKNKIRELTYEEVQKINHVYSLMKENQSKFLIANRKDILKQAVEYNITYHSAFI